MRKCSQCGKSGHNKATCGKPQKTQQYVPKGTRRCGRCGQTGHNKATCKTDPSDFTPEEDNTLKAKGRKLLAESRKKAERIEIQGVKPQKGLWIIKPDENKIAGMIKFVRRNGNIVWEDFSGVMVDTEQDRVIRSGYQYTNSIPEGDWKTLNLGEWVLEEL